MSKKLLYISILLLCLYHTAISQNVRVIDTITSKFNNNLQQLQKIPLKAITKVATKIDKYNKRVITKTEKTLTKLSRWENKLRPLLQKASPETAQKLYGNNQLTFSSLLEQLKKGESIFEGYKAEYNSYQDKLTTSLKYLEQQKSNLNSKLIIPIKNANKKATELSANLDNSEAIQKFIKERRKKLVNEAIKYLGKSKYLTKIDKESFYYIETLKNYKELFSNPKKTELVAIKILDKIPAFNQFMKKNSMLAKLFRSSDISNIDMANISGLQTIAETKSLIDDKISSGGPNAKQIVSENLQNAQRELIKLKNEVIKKANNGSGELEMPNSKPNLQKTKTFWQRLEYGANFQPIKSNNLVPASFDIALNVGYKLNNKSIVGIGSSYKLGLGTIKNIRLSSQGLGIRSYLDWKLKKQFFISGGFEMNYFSSFKDIAQLKTVNDWQQSGLIGITKKVGVKTKFFKATKVQLLYDVLANKHKPVSQPVLFRVGYSFK